MPKVPVLHVSGEKLRHLREGDLLLTRRELGVAVGWSPESVKGYEKPGTNGVPGSFVNALAKHMGITLGKLRARLRPEVGDLANEDLPAEAVIEADDVSMDVRPGSIEPVPEIPLFDLPLAAGGWNEVSEPAIVRNADTRLRGRFRVRLSGDSMMPVYPNGQVVEFQYVDGTKAGRDYYVQLLDGRATFKRLGSMGRDGLVLQALNVERYPSSLRVPHDLVAHYALAVARVELLSGGA